MFLTKILGKKMAIEPRFQSTLSASRQEEIDQGLRAYMLNVYNYMALGVAFTGLIVLLVSTQPMLVAQIASGMTKWILFALVLGLGWFAPKVIMTKSMAAAQALYWVYAAAWGLMITPLVYYVLQSEQGIFMVARAFFITSAMFAGASLFGYVTKKDLSGFGRFLMLATFGLIAAMLVNIFFFNDGMASLLISLLVVLVFAGMTAYETQMIKNLYFDASQDMVNRFAIFGALTLYGSFVTMFIHTLFILQSFMGGDD